MSVLIMAVCLSVADTLFKELSTNFELGPNLMIRFLAWKVERS